MDDVVTITRERLEDLLEKEAWLAALEAAGVDNWQGIDYAHDIYNEENEDEEND